MRRALLPALVLLGLFAPAAQAAIPFTAGVGNAPHVAIGQSGTAHVVWIERGGAARHCRVPAGATACAGEPAALDLASPADEPFVLPDGAALYVVMPHEADGRTYLWRSDDDGVTWGPRQTIYAWGGGDESAEPFLGPRPGEVTFASAGDASTVWSAALDGSEAAASARVALADNDAVTVAATGDGGLVAVTEDETLYRMRFQRMAPGGDPSDPAAWSAVQGLARGDNASLATGRDGTFLLTTLADQEANGEVAGHHQELRRWDGTSFGPERRHDLSVSHLADLHIGPSGTMAGLWPSGEKLQLALSRDGGATFSTSYLAFERSRMPGADIALRPDDTGVAVYEGRDAFDRQTVDDVGPALIRVADTEPEQTIDFGGYMGLPRVPGASIGVTAGGLRGSAGDCAYVGQRFGLRIDVNSRKRRGRFRRIVRADFLLGDRLVATDRRKPFRSRLPVAGLTLGEVYTWRVDVRIRLRGGATITRTASRPFRIC